jgi:hypothetical protein
MLASLLIAIPCLMAGVMSMDSPKAQNSTAAHMVCYTILSFPLVMMVCGILSAFILSGRLGLVVSLLPYIEVILFLSIVFLTQKVN